MNFDRNKVEMVKQQYPVGTRIRRITGYLTGTLDGWNSAKRAEEKDRVKHSVNTNRRE